MRSVFGLLVTIATVAFFGAFSWMHLRRSADVDIKATPIIEQARRAQQTQNPSSDAPDSQPGVTMVGPLAKYMAQQDAAKAEAEKIETVPYTPVASDHVGGSVVGTSAAVLKDKFRVSRTVDLPFEVPAHASTPRLHGTFRSFVQAGGKPSSDTQADLEFRLLNDEEFTKYLNGQPSEALFAAESTHNQEVNASLPPTVSQSAKYHMVFMNTVSVTRKVVLADFEIDF